MENKEVVKGEVNFEDMTSRNVLEKKNVQKMSGETPSVLNKSHFTGSNTGPVNVTDFLNGSPGQRIYILGDGQMTLIYSSLIVTNIGANKLLAAGQVYRFTFFPIEGPPRSHKWVEDAGIGSGTAPAGHHTTHENGGGDPIKLDDLNPPDDNTDLNVTITKHGLTPKAPNDTTKFLRGDATWAVPPAPGSSGLVIGTAIATSIDNTHTALNTWEDILDQALTGPLSVTVVTTASGLLLCNFSFVCRSTSANWDYRAVRFVLDGTTFSEVWQESIDAPPLYPSERRLRNVHTIFSGVAAGSHTVKVQWHDGNSGQDQVYYTRRLTVMSDKF